MKKTIACYVLASSLFLIACQPGQTELNAAQVSLEQKAIGAMLDSFNRAAATGNFNEYFSYYNEGAIFTGTDATERWTKAEFMTWAKPYFDRGKAWDFTAVDRHIYFNKTGDIAWFDELLKTQMKICRGSGVLEKKDGSWKLNQYILSTTIPNELIDSVIQLKGAREDSLLRAIAP